MKKILQSRVVATLLIFVLIAFGLFAYQNCGPVRLTHLAEDPSLPPPFVEDPIEPSPIDNDVTIQMPAGTIPVAVPVRSDCGIIQTDPQGVGTIAWIGTRNPPNYGSELIPLPRRVDCTNSLPQNLMSDPNSYLVLQFKTPTVATALAANNAVMGYLAAGGNFVSLSTDTPDHSPSVKEACTSLNHAFVNWSLGNVGSGQGGVQASLANRTDVCVLTENTTYYLTVVSMTKMRPDLEYSPQGHFPLPTKLFDRIVVNEGYDAKPTCQYDPSNPVFVGINSNGTSRPLSGARNGLVYRGRETGVATSYGGPIYPVTYVDPGQNPNGTATVDPGHSMTPGCTSIYPARIINGVALLQQVKDLSPTVFGLFNALNTWLNNGNCNRSEYFGYGPIMAYGLSVQNRNLPPDLDSGNINPGSILSLKFRTPAFGENAGAVKMSRDISPYIGAVTASVTMKVSECPGDFSGYQGVDTFGGTYLSGYNMLLRDGTYAGNISYIRVLKPNTIYYLNYKTTAADCSEGETSCGSGNLSLTGYDAGFLFSFHEQR